MPCDDSRARTTSREPSLLLSPSRPVGSLNSPVTGGVGGKMVNMEELAVLARRLEVVTERLEAQADARGGAPVEAKVGYESDGG